MNFYHIPLVCFLYCICKIEYSNEIVLSVCNTLIVKDGMT